MPYKKPNQSNNRNRGYNNRNNFNHTAGFKKNFRRNNYLKDPVLEVEQLETEPIQGVLRRTDHGALLVKPERSYRSEEDNEIYIKQDLCRRLSLINGCWIDGECAVIDGTRWVVKINTINGLLPEVFRFRPRINEMPAVSPTERFHLADTGDETMRIIDLIAPIGKGTRALVVSPPKAGKTTILEKLARSIKAVSPESHVIVLLIDERPEEVTLLKRSLPGIDVLASNNDQTPRDHVVLLRTTMEQVKLELECGGEVVLLLDSITRVGRAFNLYAKNNFKLMSGGLSANAMEIPRQFFGMARKIENGGSLTIIATALLDTGSRMDEFIFQEFKGTGNCEIVLDRQLADSRIFPAININLSGTRREELLYTPEEYAKIKILRRILADETTKEAAIILKDLIRRNPTNADLLKILRQL